MKYIRIVFILMSIIIACDKPVVDDCENYDFSDCELDEPSWGIAIVQLTINQENPFVPLVFYRGDFEDNIFEYADTAYFKEYKIDMPLNQYYSVKATYKSNGKTIIAIDGDDFTRKKYHVCNEDCWVISGGEYDVRLK